MSKDSLRAKSAMTATTANDNRVSEKVEERRERGRTTEGGAEGEEKERESSLERLSH